MDEFNISLLVNGISVMDNSCWKSCRSFSQMSFQIWGTASANLISITEKLEFAINNSQLK